MTAPDGKVYSEKWTEKGGYFCGEIGIIELNSFKEITTKKSIGGWY